MPARPAASTSRTVSPLAITAEGPNLRPFEGDREEVRRRIRRFRPTPRARRLPEPLDKGADEWLRRVAARDGDEMRPRAARKCSQRSGLPCAGSLARLGGYDTSD